MAWQQDKPVEEHILYESSTKTPGVLTKLGKFADEQEPDDRNYEPDFMNGQHVKVVRFASNAPKSYTMKSTTPDGQVLYKTRCKGVPMNNTTLHLATTIDDADPLEYREMQETYLHFNPKDPKAHELMYEAIKSPDHCIKTKTPQTLKRFGVRTQRSDVIKDAEGGQRTVEPWSINVTNVERTICSDGESLRWKRRRNLTDDEADYLGFDEDERRRILVPCHWNYDGSLFELS
jgi:hypothetical protein